MPFFDLPLKELESYRPERNEPADFDSFWADTLKATRQYQLNAKFEQVDYGLRAVKAVRGSMAILPILNRTAAIRIFLAS